MNRVALPIPPMVLALMLFLTSPVSANTTPQACDQTQKLNTVDNAFGAKLTRMQNYQSSYLIAHGRYYQALRSHATIPDGTNAAIDQQNSRPNYQNETLQALIDGANVPSNIPNAFTIDQYDGPNGKGYVITIEAMICGKHMARSVQVGSETYREQAWHEVVAP